MLKITVTLKAGNQVVYKNVGRVVVYEGAKEVDIYSSSWEGEENWRANWTTLDVEQDADTPA
jgi:hypothetical protein